jgi:glycosyltransferase involved in cell wall biosynthesis
LVSVIMPTWNRAAVIGEAVASVVAQKYRDWELLIVDDGGTDDTEAVIGRFLGDVRVRYLKIPHRGAAGARNAGLAAAGGGLIAYLDSDNVWEPHYLAAMVRVFADPAVGCAYAALVLGEEGERRILWTPFDRDALLAANFIDMNVFMHRRGLLDACGGFDEGLRRMIDWDLILRLTEAGPAVAVPVIGARYRTHAGNRITTGESFSEAYRKIRAKWRRYSETARPIRVLYALWHYPQLSEMYVESEIQGMLRLGVRIEVWSEVEVSTPYDVSIPVHRGTLEAAIDAVAPDVLHVHWLNIARNVVGIAQARRIPVTVRGHGFEFNAGSVEALLGAAIVRRVYLYGHQLRALGVDDPRVREVGCAFDTECFRRLGEKDRRLVFRASAGLASKDLRLFLELAKRLPEHRFVLAIVACNLRESYVGELLALRREMSSPARILVNVPHDEVAVWMARAGIYLHTAAPPGAADATPIGMPVSIAEAMASGCYVLVRDLPPLVEYVAEAGLAYRDVEHAAEIISATALWDDAEWQRADTLARDRGWSRFSGDDDFHAIYEDWAGVLNEVPDD